MQPLPKGYIDKMFEESRIGCRVKVSNFSCAFGAICEICGRKRSNASASADFERPCWAKNRTNSGTAKSSRRSNILHSSPYLFCHVLSLQLLDGSPYLIGNLRSATKSLMKKVEHCVFSSCPSRREVLHHVTSVDVIFPLFARQVAAILGNKNLQTLLLDAG